MGLTADQEARVAAMIADQYPDPRRMGKNLRGPDASAADSAVMVSRMNEYSKAIDGKPIKLVPNGTASIDARAHGTNPDELGFPIELVMTVGTFLLQPRPEREEIIKGVLGKPSLVMIAGPRGCGKTRLVVSLLDAITRKKQWLAWEVLKPLRALYFDGELAAVDLATVFTDMCGGAPSELLEVISSEMFFRREEMPFTLNSPLHQQRFLLLLDALEAAGRRPDVICFDNLSAMSYGTEENSNSEQDSLIRFLMGLRHRGHSVIVVHHTGRNNEPRGASRKEDPLNLLIKLENEEGQHNAKFTLKFTKTRGKMPTPSALECELMPAENGGLTWGWTVADRQPETWVQCLRIVQTVKPKNQGEVAHIMDLDKSVVSRHLAKARGKNLLDEGLNITPAGLQYLQKVFE